MASIIAIFNANKLNYTFASSEANGGTKAEDAIKSSFYTNAIPYYWQITFSQTVTAESFQFCPNSPTGTFVKKWTVSSSNGTYFTVLQEDSLSSPASCPLKFNFSVPISFKSFKISVTRDQGWLRVGEFDLFGTTIIKKSVPVNFRRIQQKIRSNIIIIMMPLTT